MSTTKTPAEIATMRAEIAAYDAALAAEAEAKRQAYLQPATSLVNGAAFKSVFADLRAMQEAYEEDGNFSIHINALITIMPNLASLVGVNLLQADPMPVEPMPVDPNAPMPVEPEVELENEDAE